MTGLYRPAGSLAVDGWSVVLTPEDAGWGFSGLRAGTLAPGGRLAFDSGADEIVVLPLEGGFDVVVDGELATSTVPRSISLGRVSAPVISKSAS